VEGTCKRWNTEPLAKMLNMGGKDEIDSTIVGVYFYVKYPSMYSGLMNVLSWVLYKKS
jgi:hypothetical protein